MFKYAVFTDEITQDLDLAISVAKEYNMDAVEIRSVWDTGIHKMTDDQVKEIKKKCDAAGLAICGIGTPFFKCEIDSPEEIMEHHQILRRCCDIARVFETDIIRGFTFWRRGPIQEVYQRILDNFEVPLKILEEKDQRMVIENEASTYLGTGAQVASFLDEIGSPRLAAVWDPCNVLFDFDNEEIPFPEGYRALRKHIVHIHLKDAERLGPQEAHCVRMGEGEIDYKGQFRALLDDGYDGYVSLETHWRPQDISEEEMNKPGGSSYSKDGEFASRRCIESTYAMVEEIKKDLA